VTTFNRKNYIEGELSQAKAREEKLFTRRDECEAQVAQIIGWELTPMQLLQLRNAVAKWEQYEEAIDKVQERLRYYQEALSDMAGV